MKPILHFQIPEFMMQGKSNMNTNKIIISGLKQRFSGEYDIIISPYIFQAEGMTTFTITSETDIDMFIKKLEDYAKSDYNFHNKYLPAGVYLMRDFDGDPDVNPLESMDQYWINMLSPINNSTYSTDYILKYLKTHDINPNLITALQTVDDQLIIKIQMTTKYGLSENNIHEAYIVAYKAREANSIKENK